MGPNGEFGAGQGVQAQLVLALLLSALLPLFLLAHPPQTHAVKLDLFWHDDGAAPPTPSPAVYLLTSLRIPEGFAEPRPRLVHELEVTADGRTLLDGKDVDVLTLRMMLDIIQVRDDEWINLRPSPGARYELFMEVLAVTKRASIYRLRLDNSDFYDAIG